MLVRLKKLYIERVLLFVLLIGMFSDIHMISTNAFIFQNTQSSADFFLEIFAPTEIEYWEKINITIEIREKSNISHENMAINLTLESGLNLAEGENGEYDLGDFAPLEEKNASFMITASQTFLNNPIVLYKVYLHKDGILMDVDTRINGDVYTLQYGISSINVLYPILKVTSSPLEITGFVVPRISLLNNQKQSLTYNISNEGDASLQNLTLRVEYDEKVVELQSMILSRVIDGKTVDNVSLSSDTFPSLSLFPGKSYVLFQINIRCITFSATDHSRVYLFVSTDFFGEREYSVQVQTYDIYNPYKYDNPLVFLAWPVYIIFFMILGLLIIIYSWKKHDRRLKKARELEEKYGTSYVSCD